MRAPSLFLRLLLLLPLTLLAGAAPAVSAAPAPAAAGVTRLPLDRIRLPAGFKIAVYSDAVPGARSIARSPAGIVYLGTREQGKVYALVDRNKDGLADQVYTIASGLRSPNGVAWRNGALYVAEISRVLRYDGIDGKLAKPPAPVVVSSAFPGDAHHGWKFIRYGPDGRLYVPVGAPCNICDPDKPIYASITRLPAAGGGLPEIMARGVRNTVGFDWHPKTHELWFTDNGRDWLGEDSPPDELNHAAKPGLHFGFPYCHGGDIADPELGKDHPCSRYVPPVQKLGPHVAAIGMRFYTGTSFPPEYRSQIFIAEHGSWNRARPLGYRVTLVRLAGDKATAYETFAEGWLDADGQAWGRPVDVEVMPDGALLVSDDKAGAVYRISYSPPASLPASPPAAPPAGGR
jgi:glucose/arabinose dehydrogenase